jgi:thiamine-phosphate pyrophosphorylase
MTMPADELKRALALMAIVPDVHADAEEILQLVRPALAAGATSLQYRNKLDTDPRHRVHACAVLQAACRASGVLFVVNDDPSTALAIGADAVHLGPSDMPVAQARELLGQGVVIGASAGSVEAALRAVEAGADYLGVGAIFDARASKANASAPAGTGLLLRMRADPRLAAVPIVAIGGIDVSNAGECIRAGADGVATIRAVFGSGDVALAASALRQSVVLASAFE